MKTILDSRVGILVVAIGLLLMGFAWGFIACNAWWQTEDPLWSAKRQWEEYERNSVSGVHHDPEPSLTALASMGEIESSVVVLPTVPKNAEVSKLWVRFGNPDILWGQGPRYPPDFKIQGEEPFYFQIWYRRSAKKDVQEMIRQLEAQAEEQRQQAQDLPVEQ